MPLRTPALPADLPQWGDDGRFRALGLTDGADEVGAPLPSRDGLIAKSAPGFSKELYSGSVIFGSVAEEDAQRRKSVVKAALVEAARQFPRLATTATIRIASDAAEAFLRTHRDQPLSFPLLDSDRDELAQRIAHDAREFKAHSAPTPENLLRPPGVSGAMGGSRPGQAGGSGQNRPRAPGATAAAAARNPTLDKAAEEAHLAAFHEVQVSHRMRLQRFFARHDPPRLREVDRLLEAASDRGYAGAEDDLIRDLVQCYGPEPSADAAHRPLAAISEPVIGKDGTVHVFASVQGENTDMPSWSLSMGNAISSTPMGLDVLESLGVAAAHVVSSTDLSEFDRALTLCLDLKPGAVHPGRQYTVYLSMLGRGGLKARDSWTFFVDPVS